MDRYTVSSLTGLIADSLGAEFGDVWVEGEISGFKQHGSGHWYFALKDERAVLACAMFRGDNLRVRKPPREGDRVLCRGGVDVYPPRGTYSLIVRRIEPVGLGELQRRLEELRARLAAEGLFDPARKRPLPTYPEAIGVVTSPTGAALQDILRVVAQRWPSIPVYLAPCRVQGDGAAAEIAAAIDLVNAHGKASVLIVGRGGGSVEDLWAFNEEAVVRAVARSAIPTVSAVGHEVDVSLCDLAADVRAATPSHAAELVTPDAAALAGWLDEQRARLVAGATRHVRSGRDRVARVRLQHPRQRVERARLRADELDERLDTALRRHLAIRRERLVRLRLRVPDAARRRARLVELAPRLERAFRRMRERRAEALGAAAAHLHALSPLAVLDRGYAIARVDGRVVTDAGAVVPGTQIEVQLARGTLDATVRGSR